MEDNGIKRDCVWYDFGRTAPTAYGAFCSCIDSPRHGLMSVGHCDGCSEYMTSELGEKLTCGDLNCPYWRHGGCDFNGPCWALQKRVTVLREALESLAAEQNGPPLIRDEKTWVEAMSMARKALEETK